uniref:Uncharacterized protein n=1 Tax=Arundo donax TaxID=35708 RepID=A0A0A9BHD9_ARUDO
MHSWPISNRVKPVAPSYVRMPGRPRKERIREPQEKPKATRISMVGTIITCRKCKGAGHNISTCDQRNGGQGASTAAISQASQAVVMVSSTQQSSNTGTKRKRSAEISQQSQKRSGLGLVISDRTDTTNSKKQKQPITTTTARAMVTATAGGTLRHPES